MSKKYKSTKLLEAAIRQHRADYRIDKGAFEKGVNHGLTIALGVINNDDEVPAAPVEPVVRGEWKDHPIPDEDEEHGKFDMMWYECSVCGKLVFWNFDKTDFCSSCGAVMTEAGRKKVMERSGSGEKTN